jgi:hypothetical protein
MKKERKRLDYTSVFLLPSKDISITALSPSHFCWNTFCFVSVHKCLLYTLSTAAIHKDLTSLTSPFASPGTYTSVILLFVTNLLPSALHILVPLSERYVSILHTLQLHTSFCLNSLYSLTCVRDLYISALRTLLPLSDSSLFRPL